MNKSYFIQAKFILKILPLLNDYPDFALKGGTAINFFYRNLPRLSVDIDITYLPIKNRNTTLSNITNFLNDISHAMGNKYSKLTITRKYISGTNYLRGIIVNFENIAVKIEPNIIFRGYVFPPEIKELSINAQEIFNVSVDIQTLSFEDLYGSKICAALDRQHPRDLFDIRILLDNEGITDKVKTAFILYLISHPRPIAELLQPNIQSIERIYEQEFKGMTFINISLEKLKEARQLLIEQINNKLTTDERRFLLSFKSGSPEWNLLNLISKNIPNLPAIRWKQLNIRKMDKKKHQKALEKLKRIL